MVCFKYNQILSKECVKNLTLIYARNELHKRRESNNCREKSRLIKKCKMLPRNTGARVCFGALCGIHK